MKLLMNHLPKCAGNAIALQFRVMFGSDQVFEIRHPVRERLSATDLSKYAFVYGHLGMSLEQRLGAGRQRFSLMRAPIDRVLSAYFFFLQLKKANSPIVANVGEKTLEEYVTSEDHDICRTTWNEQSRQLLGLPDRGPTDPGLAKNFVIERLHLLDRFLVIGVYERFQLSLDVISWLLALPRMRGEVTANRTHADWHSLEISERVLEAVRVRNQVDLALYEYVTTRFETLCKRMMDSLVSYHYFSNLPERRGGFQVIEFSGPVPGSGWYQEETGDGIAFRWMGKGGASIYFTGYCGGTLRVRLHIKNIFPAVRQDRIVIELDGRKLVHRLVRARVGGRVLLARSPRTELRKGHVLTIRTSTWRAPMRNDDRTLALAVSRAELKVSPGAPTHPLMVSRAPFERPESFDARAAGSDAIRVEGGARSAKS
jgi:hypothetical protein